MPKVVDHDLRRTELLAAVTRVIAQGGLDDATNRTIAEETGWSTGTLAHYFDGKDDLIHQTLVHVHASQSRRMRNLQTDRPVRETLREYIFNTLPMDDDLRAEAIVEINFWPRALHNDALSAVQRADFERWNDTVRGLLERAASNGQLREPLSPSDAAGIIIAFVDGLQLEAALHPRRLSPPVMTRLVDALLDSFFVN